ncbi:MAG TPA: glyoxalase [Deltaproteobacteria bacterium]|nr:glyoxalase [Deltaproteobacteria bacterium]HCP46965.1 glyoxalase [Deltaproteobacteria bacterium]|tara:strand:+ start:394 stop:801 length:408 start_codon:yes stop_codon:yes gene_type:complete
MSYKPKLAGIAHAGIRVYDLARSRHFYELIGFDFVVGPIGPEPVAIMSHPSGACINLVLNADAESKTNVLMDIPVKHPGYTHIALYVDDVEQMAALLEGAGYPITEGPVTFPDGTVAIFVRDPDGNVVEFDQSSP